MEDEYGREVDPLATQYAIRLGACFPQARPPLTTISEWAWEFNGLEDEQMKATFDLLKSLYDKPPSIPQIRKCILTAKQRREGFNLPQPDEVPEDAPTSFAEWAKTDPKRARKLVGALTGTSYVRAELEEVIAKGTAIFDGLATGAEQAPRWDGLNSPCKFCGQPVRATGPDVASKWSKEDQRWTNVHLSCAEARVG